MIVYRICPGFVKRKFSIVLLLSSSPPCPQKDPASRRERRAVRRGLQFERKEDYLLSSSARRGELGLAGGIQRAADRDGGGSVGQVLAALKHLVMTLAAIGAQEPFSIKATVRFW